MTAELVIVIPTYNERHNIVPLINCLNDALKGISWEAVFVDDDSKDGTADVVRKLAQKDRQIRVLHRVGRRGLSSACIEGMLSTSAPYIAVIDADLQHDHVLLPKMYDVLRNQKIDMVVGSRYLKDGSVEKWNKSRLLGSRFATLIGQAISKFGLTDPMSGFFMLRRPLLQKVVHRLAGKGFKILLDIVSVAPANTKVTELPYSFGTRQAGESKLGLRVIYEYFLMIVEKTVGRYIPVRFLMFISVGAIGAVAHITILGFLLKAGNLTFLYAQSAAVLIAMSVNFILNNLFSYHDQRLRGWKFVEGLLSFYLACGIGAFINLSIALFLYHSSIIWWVSGLLGAVVGSVWNYAITSTYTWHVKSDEGISFHE